MARLVEDSSALDGLSPRDAGGFVDEMRRLLADLDEAAGQLCGAYDAELKRVYGYEWLHVKPANGPQELQAARERWLEARRSFEAAVAARAGASS